MDEKKWQLLSASLLTNKSIEKVRALSHLFKQKDPSIVLMTEVGGEESLNNLNNYFLNSKYNVLHERSNSDRGIDLGLMVNKTLNKTVKLINHLGDGKKFKFSRCVYEINIYDKGKVILQIFHTHLKSKLSKPGDFEGLSQRRLECEHLAKIIEKKKRKYQAAQIISGDLNGIYEQEPEFSPIIDLNFDNLFKLHNIEEAKRTTYVYFDHRKSPIHMQLDYFLATKEYLNFFPIAPQVLDFDGNPLSNYPISLKERYLQASDHFPIYLPVKLNSV